MSRRTSLAFLLALCAFGAVTAVDYTKQTDSDAWPGNCQDTNVLIRFFSTLISSFVRSSDLLSHFRLLAAEILQCSTSVFSQMLLVPLHGAMTC